MCSCALGEVNCFITFFFFFFVALQSKHPYKNGKHKFWFLRFFFFLNTMYRKVPVINVLSLSSTEALPMQFIYRTRDKIWDFYEVFSFTLLKINNFRSPHSFVISSVYYSTFLVRCLPSHQAKCCYQSRFKNPFTSHLTHLCWN